MIIYQAAPTKPLIEPNILLDNINLNAVDIFTHPSSNRSASGSVGKEIPNHIDAVRLTANFTHQDRRIPFYGTYLIPFVWV